MSIFQKRAERFSVESVRRSIEEGRPSEGLRAMAYLLDRSYVDDPADSIREIPRQIFDDFSVEGKQRQADIKAIRELVRGYERENGIDLLGDERHLRWRAFRNKKSERFSVESVKRVLDEGRPSEALRAIAYSITKSKIADPKGWGAPILVIDTESPEGKRRQAERTEMRSLVRSYEAATGTTVLGNEWFLRIRAMGLKLRGK